jgi:hypothetical protein
MSLFTDYCRTFRINVDAESLDIGSKDSELSIFTGQYPLITPGGHNFSHQSDQVLHLIINELQHFSYPAVK